MNTKLSSFFHSKHSIHSILRIRLDRIHRSIHRSGSAAVRPAALPPCCRGPDPQKYCRECPALLRPDGQALCGRPCRRGGGHGQSFQKLHVSPAGIAGGVCGVFGGGLCGVQIGRQRHFHSMWTSSPCPRRSSSSGTASSCESGSSFHFSSPDTTAADL